MKAQPRNEIEDNDKIKEMLQELKIVVDKHPYTPKSKYLHPMDCNDIVIGAARSVGRNTGL